MKLCYPSFYSFTVVLSSSLLAAQITNQTDIKTLNLGDEFTYTISIDANYSDDALDIRPLFKNFIIGNLKISHASTNSTTWAIPLQPVSAGQITIPELPIADTKTKSLIIDVNEKNADTANSQHVEPTTAVENSASELSSSASPLMESQLNAESAYIDEILSFTVKIALKSNPNKKPLIIESSNDFRVLLSSEPTNDKEIFADHYQDTLTYTYELVAEKAGTLLLPRFALPENEARTDEQTIDIKPIPGSFHDSKNNWRPSSGISIEDHWEPQTSYAKIGQPITRSITITGINNTPDQLPDIEMPDIPYIKIYADGKKNEQENQNGMLISKKTIKHIYIPEKNIPFIAPAIDINWWNTISDRAQKSSIEDRKFLASVIEQKNPSAAPPIEKKTPSYIESLKIQLFPKVLFALEIISPSLVVLLLLIFNFRKKIKSRYELYLLWNKVKYTCQHNEPIPAHQAILTWASLYYGATFTAIEKLPFYIAVKVELDDLQAACFNQMTGNWSGKKLLHKLSKSSNLTIKKNL